MSEYIPLRSIEKPSLFEQRGDSAFDSFPLFLITVAVNIVLVTVLSTILSDSTVAWIIGSVILVQLFFVGRFLYNTARTAIKDRKRIEKCEKQTTFPHELIDGFFEWERNDKIKIYNPYKDKSRYYEHIEGYYQGVMDDHTILLSKSYQYKYGSSPSELFRISPYLFHYFEGTNESLERRRKNVAYKSALESLSESQYMELIDEVSRVMEDETESGKNPDSQMDSEPMTPIQENVEHSIKRIEQNYASLKEKI